MKHLKKWLSLILCGCMVFSLMACGTGSTDGAKVLAYGRYVEEDITPEGIKGYLTVLKDFGNGHFDVISQDWDNETYRSTYYRYITKDNGTTWVPFDMSFAEDYQTRYNGEPEEEMPEEMVNIDGVMMPLEDGSVVVRIMTWNSITFEQTNKIMRVLADGTVEDYVLPATEKILAENPQTRISEMKEIGNGRMLIMYYNMPTPEQQKEAEESGNWEGLYTEGNIIVDAKTGETLLDLSDKEVRYDGVYISKDTLFTRSYDNQMIAYDLVSGTISDAKLLSKEQMDEIDRNGYPFIFVDDDANFYTVGARGVDKYIPGAEETKPESVMEGLNYTFGAPIVYPSGASMNSDKEFVISVSYSSGDTPKILRYVYDEKAIAETDSVLRVYSLYENSTVRMALSELKRLHPEVTLKYETAFTAEQMYSQEEGGLTEEDAITALNIEILAGKGPDVLILDGLPMESYITQGVLEDLSKLVEGKELRHNMIDPLRVDGKLYTVPAIFGIPSIFGNKGYVNQFANLASLKDAIVAGGDNANKEPDWENMTDEENMMYNEKHWLPLKEEDQPVVAFSSLDELFTNLYSVSEPEIFTQKSGINEAKLREFLQIGKEISDKYQLSDSDASNAGGSVSYSSSMVMTGGGSYRIMGGGGYSSSLDEYLNHRSRLGFVVFNSLNSLSSIGWRVLYDGDNFISTSTGGGVMSDVEGETTEGETTEGETTEGETTEGDSTEGETADVENEDEIGEKYQPPTVDFEVPKLDPDGEIAPALGQSTYVPQVLVGVCSTSKNMDMANAFVDTLLSDGVQKHDLYEGLPISLTGFASQIELYKKNNPMRDREGKAVDPYVFDFESVFSKATLPLRNNSYLMKIISDKFVIYANGTADLDKTVKDILTETETYFGELQ